MPASARAIRTWESGVGSDANACSRTAPCLTFAGVIGKTAVGGEIDCLDPGGIGTINITKAITIDCGRVAGSILAAGTTGVIVNAGVSDRIVLRNLNIQGVGTGTNGNPLPCRPASDSRERQDRRVHDDTVSRACKYRLYSQGP